MQRRPRGTGTIEAHRGRYRIRITDDLGVRRSLGIVDTIEEASAILAAAADDLAKARVRPAVGATLSEYGALWLDRRDEQGLVDERSRWNVHIAPHPIADLPVRAIEPYDVRSWVERVARSGRRRGNRHRTGDNGLLSPQTIRNALNLMRSCLASAVNDRLIAVNPAAGVTVPKRQEDLKRSIVEPWTWLDLGEQMTLLEGIAEPYRWLVQWAVWTGMREGEQWALRSVDVHADSPHPHVVVRRGTSDGPTKTRRIRYVPLLPGADEAWERWSSHPTVARKIADTGVAFPPLRGSRRATRCPGPPPLWWARGVSIVRGQTGTPVTWHSLRHTCASMLVSGSWGRAWSLEEVREFMGHRSITTTQRYAHLARSAVVRAAEETRAAMALPSAEVRPARQAHGKPTG